LSCIKAGGAAASECDHGQIDNLPVPASGFDVQTLWPPHEDEAPGRHYESVTCPSCARLHFVNRKTGKLLGYGKERE
jgi:hypothetical protein